MVVADNSRPVWCRECSLSAIVCDPPYGIREPTTKVGTNKDNVVITEEQLAHHIPQKVSDVDYLTRQIQFQPLGIRLTTVWAISTWIS